MKLNNINPESRAVLWDLDGTIVDSSRGHHLAWEKTFQKYGLPFTEEVFVFTFGRRNEETIWKYFGRDIAPQKLNAIANYKEKTFRRLIKGNIVALPGVVALIKSLLDAGFKQALVSSTPIENIQLITVTLGVKDCFEVIIAGGDVTKGKPNPQGFLLATEKLSVEPKNCVVMEDAVAGVTAAKRGGMHCIAVTNSHPKERLLKADIVVDSLEKITINAIKKLLRS
jgi:HAD superfamily hydrolase (TIGR01509 family)